MASVRDRSNQADMVAAVAETVEALVTVWDRAEEGIWPQVSPSQLRALLVVARHGSTNLNGLAGELGAIPSSASRLCDRLVAAGLLIREPSGHDRREVALQLSRDGQRLVDDLDRRRRTDLDRALGEMTPSGRRALLTGLEQFTDAISQQPPELRERTA